MPEVSVWYDDAIGRVRISSTPGGDALDADGARAFRDELDDAIAKAEAQG